MGEHREVIHERLHLREPNTERLRKTAAGRLKRLVAQGWRETQRWNRGEYIEVRLERSGVAPERLRLPRHEPEIRDRPRGRGDRQGFRR
ncbi:MAG TPA: hypothetical protein VNO17_09335 [Actinomycetota bacterium]|nr:hypothetical protein [Actinomycetota bacterium]